MTSLNARVHATVTAHCPDADLILAMLGIVNEHGQLLPDDVRDYPISNLDTAPGAQPTPKSDHRLRPRESSAPDALRVLQPVTTPRKPRSAAQKAGQPQASNNARKQPCGTEAAARRHTYYKEPLCDECAKGRAERKAANVKPPKTAPCGTVGAYQRHLRHNEPTDEPCREANRVYNRAKRAWWRRERGLPPLTHAAVAEHGGSGAYNRHYRTGEPLCEPCRTWKRENSRKYKAAKKAAQ